MWPHQRLVVYRRAIDAVTMLDRVASQLPPADDLRDQLKRASTSIVLNLAEGASEWSRAEKDRFFRMARRSAAECVAILDVVEHVRDLKVEADTRATLDEVGAMLTSLVRRKSAE